MYINGTQIGRQLQVMCIIRKSHIYLTDYNISNNLPIYKLQTENE